MNISFDALLRNRPDEEPIELEMRSNPSKNKNEIANLLNHYDFEKPIRYKKYMHKDERVLVYPDKRIFQLKTRLAFEELREYSIKLVSSLEEDLEEFEDYLDFNYEYVTRQTCKLGNYLLEVFTTKQANQTIYRYELEIVLEADQELDTKEFSNLITQVYLVAKGSKQLYTFNQKKKIANMINRMLGSDDTTGNFVDRKQLSNARGIKQEDFVIGGLVNNPNYNYLVTNKADGIRKLLVFDALGIWLVFGSEFNLVIKTKLAIKFSDLIIEGEFIPKDSLFLAFDCLYYKEDIRNQTLLERIKHLRILEGIKFAGLTYQVKDYYYLYQDSFYLVLANLLLRDDLNFATDGLVFTANTVYNYWQGKEPVEISERFTSLYPDILKWKPVEQITVDLFYSRDNFYAADPVTGEYVPVEDFYLDIWPTETGIWELAVPNKSFPNYKMIKARLDKQRPNTIDVVYDNVDAALNPITRKMLLSKEEFLADYEYSQTILELSRLSNKILIIHATNAFDLKLIRYKNTQYYHYFSDVQPTKLNARDVLVKNLKDVDLQEFAIISIGIPKELSYLRYQKTFYIFDPYVMLPCAEESQYKYLLNAKDQELHHGYSIVYSNLLTSRALRSIYTIGDGSCFFHALYHALNRKVYQASSTTRKQTMVAAFRKDLARAVADKPETWLRVSAGLLPRLYTQALLADYEEENDYSLTGIVELIQSNCQANFFVYDLICEVLNISLVVVNSASKKIIHKYFVPDRPVVIIKYIFGGNRNKKQETGHYENVVEELFPNGKNSIILSVFRPCRFPDLEVSAGLATDQEITEELVQLFLDAQLDKRRNVLSKQLATFEPEYARILRLALETYRKI